nr:transposase [Enterocloster clostridioformis]
MSDPIALDAWYSDENNDSLLQTELEHYLQNYFSCFSQQPQRRLFQTFIQGLLSPLERKSIEPIALHFSGEKYVRPLQQFFTRSPFDEQPLLDTYQELLSRQIGAGCGMLSVDDTSFVKKGKHSAGVKRQYCGCLGKTENCQSGVFLAYAGDKGYGLVDYELYIPKEWFSGDYSKLREECHIPEEKTFATKNQIAQHMLNQVIKSGRFQVQWAGV